MVWTQEYQLFVLCDRPGESSLQKDWCVDYPSGSHLQGQWRVFVRWWYYSSLDSEDDYHSGSWNISHQQQSFWRQLSPGRSHKTNNFLLMATFGGSFSSGLALFQFTLLKHVVMCRIVPGHLPSTNKRYCTNRTLLCHLYHYIIINDNNFIIVIIL